MSERMHYRGGWWEYRTYGLMLSGEHRLPARWLVMSPTRRVRSKYGQVSTETDLLGTAPTRDAARQAINLILDRPTP